MTARVSERTNQNVYILSVISVLFMPLNLITGFFGMNVGGIPGVGSDEGFAWVSSGMAICAVGTWLLFKMKKWM
jgi:zinc transporter